MVNYPIEIIALRLLWVHRGKTVAVEKGEQTLKTGAERGGIATACFEVFLFVIEEREQASPSLIRGAFVGVACKIGCNGAHVRPRLGRRRSEHQSEHGHE
jgi:hypothetical protein